MTAKEGRPPVQHIKHVHVLRLSPELEEKIDDLKNAWIARGALRVLGNVLSHPVGIAVVTSLVLIALGRAMKTTEAQNEFWTIVSPFTAILAGKLDLEPDALLSKLKSAGRGTIEFLAGLIPKL